MRGGRGRAGHGGTSHAAGASSRTAGSPSGAAAYGTAAFKPTMAGEANKPGGVYERLASPDSFTGVYRRAWLTDGRINHFSETGLSSVSTRFEGNTNTRSDETIHDIKHLLRRNLMQGPQMKVPAHVSLPK